VLLARPPPRAPAADSARETGTIGRASENGLEEPQGTAEEGGDFHELSGGERKKKKIIIFLKKREKKKKKEKGKKKNSFFLSVFFFFFLTRSFFENMYFRKFCEKKKMGARCAFFVVAYGILRFCKHFFI
jgi:hypothetical protein